MNRPRFFRAISAPKWRPAKTASAAALALALGITVAGCGEIQNTVVPSAASANQITVELAGPPNAYYVGIYAAMALGYFKQTDINVTLQSPTVGQDPLTMLHDGQVPIAISSEPSVFFARNQNQPVVAVGALVQIPLSHIKVRLPVSATHLPTGGTALGGTTGTTTTATTTTTTAANTTTGTKTTAAPKTTTGTTTTGTTTTGTTTTGTTTSTNAMTTTTPTVSEVPTGSTWPGALQTLLSKPGAPTYQALVVVVRKGTIVDHAPLIRRFVQAVARGYKAVRRDPAAGVADLVAADPSLANETPALMATVKATLPYFFPSGIIWGWQSEAQWNTFGTWMSDHSLINNPNAISNASTNELLAGEGV
jgi:ABC-type nitrate/sulfonate/bicarbonate transport system substrate-binding protein